MDLVLRDGKQSQTILLILAGIWPGDESSGQYTVLPWSPVHSATAATSERDLLIKAKNWVLEQSGSAFLIVNNVAREVWRQRWPAPCVQYLNLGKFSVQQQI